jgi:spermidine synthase
VVEIDPALEGISQQYFGYTNPSNVNEIFTDARTYVNKTDTQYDVVIVDVYGDTTIPFTFMTKEYGQQLARTLSSDGLVVANIIGGQTGACRETLASVDAAYRSQLPYVWYGTESGRSEERANYVVVYAKRDIQPKGLTRLNDLKGILYTDNFAPAERLYYDCLERGK